MNEAVELAIDSGYIDIPIALQSLKPGAEWVLRGVTYEGLEWLDNDSSKPSKEEVEDEISRLNILVEQRKYREKRAKEYKDIHEQLDMLYWDFTNNTTTWKDHITEIKEKYRKPGD
tara:strand:- start:10541 stop:10888 length:348 start_codon:yes stop_codon:yes gene_type:complete